MNPARLALYDRAIANRTMAFGSVGVSPHGETIRFTYTVPAGTIAALRSVMGEIMRETAAATAGRCLTFHTMVPLSTILIAIHQATFINNVIGTDALYNVAGQIVLRAGEIYHGRTFDSSTGGTTNINISALLEETNA